MAKRNRQEELAESKPRNRRPSRRYIEIVNWTRAQPNMTGEHNAWLKLYTSLLDNDQFRGLDDTARMLIVGLWLYAAYSGRHVFPADPKWLWKRIPLLNSAPDLKPLLEATDAYGRPRPFVRYCRPPAAGKPKRACRQPEQSREEKRAEKRRTLTGSRKEKEREKKKRVSSCAQEASPDQSSAEQSRAQASIGTTPHSSSESAQPASPQESEVGAVEGHIVPLPPRSALRAGRPRHIGAIVKERFREHWTDPDAEAFGWEIVRALGLPDDPQNMVTRANWGAFAAWWCEVKHKIPPGVCGDLRTIAVRQANYVRMKNRTARKPGAVWFTIMDGELSKHGVTQPPVRAGPTASAG